VFALESISVQAGRGGRSLEAIDLRLDEGSAIAVVGPNGSGKTALLTTIGLVRRPHAGRILASGSSVWDLGRAERAALRRRIGVVFQDLRLLDHLSVFDNVALPLRIAGMDGDGTRGAVDEMLSWLGLGDLIEEKAGAVSMGQRQLVAVARAVIARPALLVADEPTAHLSSSETRRVQRLLKELAKLKTTVVLGARTAADAGDFVVHELSGGRLTGPLRAAS
jgi:cell division transport system ATP-binding protein